MVQHIELKVPGATPTAQSLEVRSPYDNRLIATLDTVDANGIEQALINATTLYRNRESWLPISQRIDILTKLKKLMLDNIDALAMQSTLEGGKPITDAKIEAYRAVESIQICIDCLRTSGGRAVPMGINPASDHHMAVTQKEPIGVVVAVSAFNHPMNLIAHQIGPAVAAGCPVIIKPATDTPLSCFSIVELLHKAGLPAMWCQALVVTDHLLATGLVTDHRVGFLSFIGSAKVGWSLRSQLAAGTRCALEHGGVAPVIIEDDADIEAHLPMIIKAGFTHAGQVCVSVQRIYCHSSIAQEVTARLAELAQSLNVGDPCLENTDIGPLIRPLEVDRVHAWVDEAVRSGADLVSGGEKLPNNCYKPTVLYNPPDSVKVSISEVFGPVICVYSFTDIQDAYTRANALTTSFQAAVFTKSLDKALAAYRSLHASAVMVNDTTAFRVDWMPFAGLKESGLCVGGIPYTFQDMQIEKMLVIRSNAL